MRNKISKYYLLNNHYLALNRYENKKEGLGDQIIYIYKLKKN